MQVVEMQEFPRHVARMHSDGDLGFSKEYESIQHAVAPGELPSTSSEKPENKAKNRYLNILACKSDISPYCEITDV